MTPEAELSEIVEALEHRDVVTLVWLGRRLLETQWDDERPELGEALADAVLAVARERATE